MYQFNVEGKWCGASFNGFAFAVTAKKLEMSRLNLRGEFRFADERRKVSQIRRPAIQSVQYMEEQSASTSSSLTHSSGMVIRCR